MAIEFKPVRRRKQARRLPIGTPALMVLTSAVLAVTSVATDSFGLFLLALFVLMGAPVAGLMFHESDPLDDLLLWLFFFW